MWKNASQKAVLPNERAQAQVLTYSALAATAMHPCDHVAQPHCAPAFGCPCRLVAKQPSFPRSAWERTAAGTLRVADTEPPIVLRSAARANKPWWAVPTPRALGDREWAIHVNLPAKAGTPTACHRDSAVG